MVFQSFNLFPHLDALTNVTLAPRVVGRRRRTEAEQAGMALLRRVGLAGHAKKLPGDLSARQQQRGAIAPPPARPPPDPLFDHPPSLIVPPATQEAPAGTIRAP